MEEGARRILNMNFNYFYKTQADEFSFIRIPKALMTEDVFSDLSIDAKILYGLLMDRMSLSVKNEWLDEQNRAYILYPIADIMEEYRVSKRKAIDTLAELEKKGLIEKKQRGMGQPSIIYVKKFQVLNA